MLKKHPFACLLLLTLAATALGAEGEGRRELVQPQISEMIWSLVTFVLFFVVLSVAVWPKILKGLQDRENKIRHDLEHAENSAKQAAATLEEYRAQLASAHDEVRKLIEQGRADAERLRAQLTDQTQAEINSMRQRAKAEILAAKEQAIGELQVQYATVATEVASKILRRQITHEDQRQLVEDSLAATSQLAKNN